MAKREEKLLFIEKKFVEISLMEWGSKISYRSFESFFSINEVDEQFNHSTFIIEFAICIYNILKLFLKCD